MLKVLAISRERAGAWSLDVGALFQKHNQILPDSPMTAASFSLPGVKIRPSAKNRGSRCFRPDQSPKKLIFAFQSTHASNDGGDRGSLVVHWFPNIQRRSLLFLRTRVHFRSASARRDRGASGRGNNYPFLLSIPLLHPGGLARFERWTQ